MTAHDPAATLAGVLSGFAVADVLQLLELGGRGGELVVDGGAQGHVVVRVDTGRIVGVNEEGVPCESAERQIATIARMLDWAAGRWTFCAADDAMTPSGAAIGVSITTVLVEAARLRDEQARRAPRTMPNADVPELTGDDDVASGAPIERLTAFDLQVLAAVDGVRDVPSIAATVRRDLDGVLGVLQRLRALGVVRSAPAQASTAVR